MGDQIIGFLDESSPQTTANTVRMWSFRKPEKIRNTTKYRANTFVFYAINGNSVIKFYENSRKEDVCSFLEAIGSHNPGKEIVLILDNFASHRSKIVKKRALDLHIRLVHLPPFSPDLNPIEFLWKSVKRIVSRTLIASEMHLKALVERTFNEISMFNSYSMGWIRKFIPKEYNKYRKLGI
jgi:putative transposase